MKLLKVKYFPFFNDKHTKIYTLQLNNVRIDLNYLSVGI